MSRKKKLPPYAKKRSKRPLLLLLVFCLASLLLLRDRLACNLLDIYLGSFLPKELRSQLVIEKKEKKNGHLYLTGVSYLSKGSTVKCESIDIYSSIDLFPFRITSYVDIRTPEIALSHGSNSQGDSSVLGLLFPSRYFALKLSVEKGTIVLPEPAKLPLYFSYSSNETTGHFRLFQDINGDGSTLCSALLSNESDLLRAKISVDASDLSSLAPIVSLLCSDHDSYLACLEGKLKGSAELCFTEEKKLQRLSVEIDLQNMIAESKDATFSCRMDSCKGRFSYPPYSLETLAIKTEKNIPFWKKAEGYVAFSGGEFFAKEQKSLGIKKMDGELMLIPSQDPSLKLTAILTNRSKEIPLELYSSGVLHEDSSFWLQSDFSFASSLENHAQATVSLCKVSEDSYVVQMDLHDIDSELLSFASHSGLLPEDVTVKTLRAEGSLTAWLDKKQLNKLQWKRFNTKEAEFRKGNLVFAIDDISSEGLLVKDREEWRLDELDIDLKKSLLIKEHLQFSDINLSFHFHDGVLQPSALAAFWNKGQMNISAFGPIHDLISKIEIDSSWNALLSMFYSHLPLEQEMHTSTKIDVALKDNLAVMQGHSQFSIEGEGEVSQLHFSLELPILGRGAIWHRAISFGDFKGTLQSDSLHSALYSPFVASIDKEISISGNIAIAAELFHAKVKGNIKSPDLFLQRGDMAISTGEIGEKKAAYFSYEFSSHSLIAEIDLTDGFFAMKNQVSLDSIQGHFSWQDHRLKAERVQALCEGISIPFSLYFDPEGLFIETALIEGKVQDICKIDMIKNCLGVASDRMEGLFSSPANGCNILLQKVENDWIWHWKIAAAFKDLSYEIAPEVRIQGAECDLFFDSSSMVSSIKKTKGNLNLWNGSYAFFLNDFVFDSRRDNEFDLKVLSGSVPLMKLAGLVRLTQDIEVVFHKEKTSILSVPIDVKEFRISKDLKIKEIDFSFLLSSSAISSCFSQVKNIKAFSTSSIHLVEDHLSSMQADIDARFTLSQPTSWSINLKSPQIIWKNTSLSDCELLATFTAPKITIEKAKWNNAYFQSSATFQDSSIRLSYLKYLSPEAKIELEGRYDIGSRVFDVPQMNFSLASSLLGAELAKYVKGAITGNAAGSFVFDDAMHVASAEANTSFSSSLQVPFACDLRAKDAISLRYDRSSGLAVKRMDLTALVRGSDEMLAKLSVDTLQFNPSLEKVLLHKCLLLLAPQGTEALSSSGMLTSDICHMKKDLDWQMTGDVTISPSGIEALLNLKPGVYSAGGKDYTLLDPKLQISSSSLHLRSHVELGLPILCDVQKEFVKGSPLYVLLRASPEAEGLKILCKERNGSFDPQRIEGKLMGLEANLQKSSHISDGSFFGFVKLDFVKADPLLSKKMKEIVSSLKLGSGYTLQGHFFLPQTEQEDFSFHGDVKAEKCQLLGYTFQSLQLKASVTAAKVLLEEIKIEDPAGQLSVKTCAINKDTFSNTWALSMPLGHIREFRPSLLMEEGKRGSEKPFVLKNLSVYDLGGVLGDAKSFTGSGALHFVNSSKKEFSFLDIPFEIIKDLGLDTGILTPISGEADFTIKKGRCLFSELKNSFSEGRRSQFYLCDDTLAYIDFDGNWHVDLKMKQHVLLKWSESLLVSIRGKLDKPKYSLKNVEDLL